MGNRSISEKMEEGIEHGVFPGAVLLCAKKGQILFHNAFGLADTFSEKKMRADSIFDLASLTKPLATALAMAKLIEKVPNLLHAPIGKMLTRFDQTDKEMITADMLLRHMSGFPAHRDYFRIIEGIAGDPSQIQEDLLAKEPLEYEPGTRQVYSDLGFMVLRQIIEIIGCTPLDQYVKTKIYDPIGAGRLFFIPRSDHHYMVKKFGHLIAATQVCPWRKKLLFGDVDDENAWAIGGVDGHAGLFGDAESVFRLCDYILRMLQNKPNGLIRSDIFQAFIQRINGYEMVAGFDTPAEQNSSCGRYFSRSSIGHLGFTGTSFWIDPEASLIVVLLTNRIHPSRSNQQLKKFRPAIHDLIYDELA